MALWAHYADMIDKLEHMDKGEMEGQFPAHQVSMFECPKLLGSIQYLTTLVIGWNKFSQWLETYLLTCLGDMHPYTHCIPSIHLRMQCGQVSGIAARRYVSMLGKT